MDISSKEFGIDVSKNKPSWQKRIHPDFLELLLTNLDNCKPTLVIDYSNISEPNDIVGLGFIKKEYAKNVIVFDISEHERILGLFESFHDNNNAVFYNLFFQFFLGDRFTGKMQKELVAILQATKDNDEGTYFWDLYRFIHDEDFWRYKISQNKQDPNDVKLNNLRNKLNNLFNENNVLNEMLSLIFLPSLYNKFRKEKFPPLIFTSIQVTKYDINQIKLISDIIILLTLSNHDSIDIFGVFDDNNVIESAKAFSLIPKSKTNVYIQKSDIIDNTILNYEYQTDAPKKKVSEILYKYSRMKYARKRKANRENE